MHSCSRIVLVGLVLVTLVACRTAAPLSPTDALPAPERHVLDNGVRVVIQEHRTSAVVALQLWVHAGGRDESDTELGLSHYLEHMLFKGTTTRPPGSIHHAVEGVGGRINASTSYDFTYYHLVVPVDALDEGLAILADISVNAAFDPEELEREKLVVLEEMRRSEDDPRSYLARRLYALAFEGHPYGRPVLGTPEIIRSLTREALLRYYRAHYVPEAFTLVVVGSVDPAAVLKTTTRLFGSTPRSGVSRLPPSTPVFAAPRRLDVRRPGAHAYIGMAWPAPGLDHPDAPALDLLSSILGETRSSRLNVTLREGNGSVSRIGSSYVPLAAAGAVLVTAQLDPANVDRVENEILGEVRHVQTSGVTEAELRRAITAVEAAYVFRNETAEGLGRSYGHAEAIWRLSDELAYVSRVRQVTREHVRDTARRILVLDRYARVALVPRRDS